MTQGKPRVDRPRPTRPRRGPKAGLRGGERGDVPTSPPPSTPPREFQEPERRGENKKDKGSSWTGREKSPLFTDATEKPNRSTRKVARTNKSREIAGFKVDTREKLCFYPQPKQEVNETAPFTTASKGTQRLRMKLALKITKC